MSVRALRRHYGERQLLHADRSADGQRHYPDSAVERVRLIPQLYAAGLASTTVRDVLPYVDSGEVPPGPVDRLVAERALIDQRITDLREHSSATTRPPAW
ncbi:MerR family transcriptional regulator [Streptomyces sp. NPDC050535]|uniref:MerR family transcriptional regulator n=1 Tax=Streptomyces sp. NPDC050535 TaxID=3365626 RepID=UPI0037BB9BB2